MTYQLTAALVVALAVAVWRIMRPRNRRRSEGPLPDVGSAPPGATPIALHRWRVEGVGGQELQFLSDADRAGRRSPD